MTGITTYTRYKDIHRAHSLLILVQLHVERLDFRGIVCHDSLFIVKV